MSLGRERRKSHDESHMAYKARRREQVMIYNNKCNITCTTMGGRRGVEGSIGSISQSRELGITRLTSDLTFHTSVIHFELPFYATINPFPLQFVIDERRSSHLGPPEPHVKTPQMQSFTP